MSTETRKVRSRYLENCNDVFSQNAWDDVTWDQEQIDGAERIISEHNKHLLSSEEVNALTGDLAESNWDSFYSTHSDKFFKDRNWLNVEFPELFPQHQQLDANFHVLEVGCGAGNTLFPLLEATANLENYYIYACDFSQVAVDIVKKSPQYEPKRSTVFKADVSDPQCSFPCSEGQLDVVIMLFVLSAIPPNKHTAVISRLAKLLKPNGVMLIRDYCRGDLTQLRFKNGSCLYDSLYKRGDKTLVYFFTPEAFQKLLESLDTFSSLKLSIDRRLQVNRAKRVKMYRVWMQVKCVKHDKV